MFLTIIDRLWFSKKALEDIFKFLVSLRVGVHHNLPYYYRLTVFFKKSVFSKQQLVWGHVLTNHSRIFVQNCNLCQVAFQ